MRFGDVGVSPDPDRTADSCPPIWVWDDCQDVDVHAPVRVTPDAAPGDYEFGFRVSETVGDASAREHEAAVTVSGP